MSAQPALPTATPPADLTRRLRALRDALLTGLVERDVAIRLALLAALAGEHLLMLGPPGTAKSLVARRLHLAFRGSSYFERLLTRFTVPEELFGPLSIKALEEDRYERITAAYLPTASVAFLDEVFKANSAILNALLTLLNEREFDNGSSRHKTPLISVVGASNELPDGEELDALFDRFLVRLHVGPVSRDAFPALLGLRGEAVPEVAQELRLTDADLLQVRVLADKVEVPGDVVALLCDLREWCLAEKLEVSDRRWRKIVKLLQVSALSNGRAKVSIWDCWLVQHVLWDTPERREGVYDWYAARVGASAAMDPTRLTRIVVSWEARLRADQDSRSQARDEQGRLLFKDSDGRPTISKIGKEQARRGKDALYLAPAESYQDYHCQRNIKDRMNGGKGYTREELKALYVSFNSRFEHWSGHAEYLANSSNWMLVDTEAQPLIEPTRHKSLYVDDCLKQIAELSADVQRYKVGLLQHMDAMEKEIRDHLWVTDDFVEPASTSLTETAAQVETLLARVDKLNRGFELLPRERSAEPAKKPAKK